jgi:tetratricopeptide (TPR) repeat protein
VTKAQLDKHLGIQQRWSKNKLREMRKLSDVDVEKYDQWVVIDDEVTTPEYKNDYRGSVQNREVKTDLLPMYSLSLMPNRSGLNSFQIIDHALEQFNREHKPKRPILIVCRPGTLDEAESGAIFAVIDSLSRAISASRDVSTALGLLLQRAVAHATTHNFSEAINDLNDYLSIDSTSVLAYWQRAFCLHELADYGSLQSSDMKLGQNFSLMRIEDDLGKALERDEHNVLLIYNRATLKALQKDYNAAIDDFRQVLQLNPNLAEAYFNLGLTYIFSGNKAEGLKNLSKAGELGLYDAYSLIKQYGE